MVAVKAPVAAPGRSLQGGGLCGFVHPSGWADTVGISFLLSLGPRFDSEIVRIELATAFLFLISQDSSVSSRVGGRLIV